MVFRTRLTYIDKDGRLPPGRVYTHHSWLWKVAKVAGDHFLDEAEVYLLDVLRRNREVLQPFDFVVAAVWKSEVPERCIDLLAFGDITGKPWPGNPDISTYVFKDGIYVTDKKIICGDMIIAAGREEEHRRTRKNLEDYIKNPPHLGALEPPKSKFLSAPICKLTV